VICVGFIRVGLPFFIMLLVLLRHKLGR
jgi:hypothetical protein